jgi:hypothetical protein
VSPSPIERLKPYFKPRPRGGAAQQAAAPVQAPATQVQAPPAQAPAPTPQVAAPPRADGLAARRELLSLRYRELQSDLGGLVYEMAIRDAFRLDVVVRRAAELQAVDAELTAVEQALGLAPGAAAATCGNCGAPAPVGSAFCGHCGSSLLPAAQPQAQAPAATPPAATPPAATPAAAAPAPSPAPPSQAPPGTG